MSDHVTRVMTYGSGIYPWEVRCSCGAGMTYKTKRSAIGWKVYHEQQAATRAPAAESEEGRE